MGLSFSSLLSILLLCGIITSCAGTPPPPLTSIRQQVADNEELLILETRPGTTTRVLITKPTDSPKGIFIHLPGGEGFLVSPNGGFYSAFRRQLAGLGYVTAIMDVPSDRSAGLEGQNGQLERFRVTQEHTQDARVVANSLLSRWQVPLYIMGHSMGAISATHFGATLGDSRLKGVVLLSAPMERGPRQSWPSVSNARMEKIAVPALLVQHRQDGCPGTPFETALSYRASFSASPRVGFIEVNGGAPPTSTNPCVGNNYHSFTNIHGKVMEGVVRWLNGENVSQVE
jgi:hypothetical protein